MQAKIILAIIGPITIIILTAMVLYGPTAEGHCMSIEGFGIKIKKEDVKCSSIIENVNQNLQETTIKYHNDTMADLLVTGTDSAGNAGSKSNFDGGGNFTKSKLSLPSLVGQWYIAGSSKVIGQYGGIIEFTDNNQFVLQLNQLGKLANPQYGSYQYNKSQNEITFAFDDGTSQVFEISNISTNAFTLSDSYGTASFVKT